jgi:hypothetical protein
MVSRKDGATIVQMDNMVVVVVDSVMASRAAGPPTLSSLAGSEEIGNSLLGGCGKMMELCVGCDCKWL